MPRKIKAGTLETRSARLRLPICSQPVYVKLAVGTSLGYRRNQTDGSWVLRATKPKGGYWTRNIGLADDYRESDGVEILTFWQAQDQVRLSAHDGAHDRSGGALGRHRQPRQRVGDREPPVFFLVIALDLRLTRTAGAHQSRAHSEDMYAFVAKFGVQTLGESHLGKLAGRVRQQVRYCYFSSD